MDCFNCASLTAAGRDPRLARFVRWDSIGASRGSFLLGLRPIGAGSACADDGALNMHMSALVTVSAIVVCFAAPTCAHDRPSDPFGSSALEMTERLGCSLWRVL